MRFSSLLFCVLFMSCSFSSLATATLEVKEGKTTDEKRHASFLKSSKSIFSVVELINETFKMSEPLTLLFGSEDGPLYDPEVNQIHIPYAFISDIESLYQSNKAAESLIDLNQFKEDVLIHTLFHELGHALIANYDLPVIGREEDAADALAAIISIDYFEQGQEIAISAAQMFQFEDLSREIEEQDLAGEHSLDIQRFYLTLCFVYGSAPKEYKYIVEDGLLDDYRAQNCVVDYQNTLASWYRLLEPFLKDATK